MILEDWSITEDFKLIGKVYDHYEYPAGKPVKTSVIVNLNEDLWIAKTASGSVYELGKPNQAYLEWLLKNNFDSGKRLQARGEQEPGATGIFKMSDNK